MRQVLILIAILFVYPSANALPAGYTWVDQDGVTNYSTTPPPAASNNGAGTEAKKSKTLKPDGAVKKSIKSELNRGLFSESDIIHAYKKVNKSFNDELSKTEAELIVLELKYKLDMRILTSKKRVVSVRVLSKDKANEELRSELVDLNALHSVHLKYYKITKHPDIAQCHLECAIIMRTRINLLTEMLNAKTLPTNII